MKRTIVVNSASRCVPRENSRGRWEKSIRQKLGGVTILYPQDREATIRETRRAIREGSEQIVAMGGDGTFNAVANGFFENGESINPRAVLALAPFGTGSDYYRTVARGSRRRWSDFIDDCDDRAVDLGIIEFLHQDLPPVYFINMASVGMSAEVVAMKNAGPQWIPASLSYCLPALTKLFSYRGFRANVVTDDGNLEDEYIALFLAKGRFAGGGMRVGGEVRLDDGKLEVTMVRQMNLLKRVIKFPRLYLGLGDGDVFKKVQASEITISSTALVPLEFDGETKGSTDVRIRVAPKSIRVCFPKNKHA